MTEHEIQLFITVNFIEQKLFTDSVRKKDKTNRSNAGHELSHRQTRRGEEAISSRKEEVKGVEQAKWTYQRSVRQAHGPHSRVIGSLNGGE